ncbi:MAG: TlpA disulfide reductase family protein [Candidatus Brocadiia bacterium]
MNKIMIMALAMMIVLGAMSCDTKINPDANPTKAPDFTLKDIRTGQDVKLSVLIGQKPIILDFWASWCPPCRALMPKLQEYYQANQDKVIIIGISGDNSKEAAESFISKSNLSFTMVYDEGQKVFSQYKISGIPTTAVINTKGEIIKQGHFDIDELKELVNSAR